MLYQSSEATSDTVVSVIIPFSYRKGDKSCLPRLYNAVACFAGRADIELIIYDTSLKAWLKSGHPVMSSRGVKYFHQPGRSVFSPGKTRNLAVQKASGRYLFFCDADLLCPQELIDALIKYCNELGKTGSQAFAMFPCLYLSENATNRILAENRIDYSLYRETYLKGLLSDVDGIAVASSCLLVERQWFLNIGGFRSEFAGHGCEDFELIHRLAAYFPAGALPDDYELDAKKQFPADYVGFRRYYSYYSLPHLFTGHFLLHQWHKRPLAKKYHRRRQENEQLFADILSSKSPPVCNGIHPFHSKQKLPEYREWIISLMQKKGYNIQQYPGLFNWQKGVSRPPGNLQRKLRKLILKPGQFFKDMV